MTAKTLIHFLEQLICPAVEPMDRQQSCSTKPPDDLDICELVEPITVDPMQTTSLGDEEKLPEQGKGFLSGNANDNLLAAAKEGSIHAAKVAIGAGANICYRKKNRNTYEIAKQSIIHYHKQSIANQLRSAESTRYEEQMRGAQLIVDLIRQTAYNKLLQGIDESSAYRVLAYHQAGAPIPGDLLNYSCHKSDNVQIIDYLINQNPDVFQAMFDSPPDELPYHVARKKKFNKVASYLKYHLSVECTKAIQANDTDYVQKLVRAGASVDMQDTNNLRVALGHQNAELVQILCENGAKLPIDWLQSATIVLPENVAQTIDSDIVFRINRSLVNRRLRFAAANADLLTLIRCQHLSADINSKNCHGSTALLCSIQYGNNFPIVHALVSRGGTILHSNDNESMSPMALAKTRNYQQITSYLSQELNTQFLMTILNNDLKSAEQFEALGADFNYHDEQQRTALHYAVQYHGVKLVSWLCVRGSIPTVADVNGNYPMTEATEKGDYAVVELFATKYPATKQQKNKAGLTARQIAQKQGFKRIEQMLETGKPVSNSSYDVEPKPDGPKHTREDLIDAAKNGHLQIVKEFIDDRYESRDDKRQLCYQLIDAAKKAKQHEVVCLLQPYYDSQLKADIPSDIEIGSFVRLNKHYKDILLRFLTGLGKVIADSPVVLDPADPNTYKDLFANLTANQRRRSQEIHKVDSEREATKLSDKDLSSINENLSSIHHELSQLNEEKGTLEQSMQETMNKLEVQENITAMQRQDLFKQQEEHKKQLAVYECSIFLYELQQEAKLNRQNTVKFIHGNPNLYLFFRTIENLLQALFHGVLAARSGMLTTEKNTLPGKISQVIDAVPASIIPFSEIVVVVAQKTLSTVLKKIDEKVQKKAYHNISTLGNIEELGRLASDTASLLTLYYKEQIQSIDTSSKIRGSNVFNDKINWIKDTVVDVRPESKEDMPVVIVAEYITGWIVELLKRGTKELDLSEPLPQQLWFSVAKENCVDQGKATTVTDVLGGSAGRQKIPLKIPTVNGENILAHVQLQYLIGCVSMVTKEGAIYQYDIAKDSANKDFVDLELFGYVYVTPFLNENQTSQPIIDGRKLVVASRNDANEILTKLKDIEQYVQTFQSHADQTRTSAITTETARQVALVLREQKSFVDSQDVKSILDKSRQETEITIDVLREDIQQKTNFYQTSIEATSEKLQKEVAEAHEALKRENDKYYNDSLKKIHEQLKQIEKNLENQITDRMNIIERQLKVECDEMRKIVEVVKEDSHQALKQAKEAADVSEQSAQYAGQLREDARKLMESTEQRQREFQVVMDQCEEKVKQTIAEQKEFCEQSINAIRTKVQGDFERIKGSAEQAATDAKESAKSANETQKHTRKQLDQQKGESNKVIAEAKETTRKNEQSTNEAKEASKLAKQAADASVAAQRRTDEMERRMESMMKQMKKSIDKV